MKATKYPNKHRGNKKKKVKKQFLLKKKKKKMQNNTHGDTDEVEEIGVQKNIETLLSLFQKRISILYFFRVHLFTK